MENKTFILRFNPLFDYYFKVFMIICETEVNISKKYMMCYEEKGFRLQGCQKWKGKW